MKFLRYYNESISDALLYGYSEKYNISPQIMELIVSRGNKNPNLIEKFLTPSKKDFYDPFLLHGMTELVARINRAVKDKEKVLIFGDYDVDGVSASAIMIKLFDKLGLVVDCYLPNRYVDGYGLTNQVLDKIKQQYNPSLIITVDCGISCKQEVEYGKSLGIEICVTDHHEIPEEIPETIVVNAKLKDQQYPFSQLCGTGVAFKIAQAIIGDAADEFLPIVAVATIADIVSLTDENRALVKLGMQNLQQLPIGVKALAKHLKLNVNQMSSTDIAFKLAPKINASGRMGDARDSLDLYFEQNPAKIKKLIKDIMNHNNDRQVLCGEVYDDCKKILSNVNMANQRAIVLYNSKWDHGILGIVCARLLEEYNRPVFLFSEENGKLKGSARSIPDVNVHSLLSDMKDILETFGGHSVAAGLSLKIDKIDEFRARVERYIFDNISDKAFIPISYYDSKIDIDKINAKVLDDLKLLEPFGCDNQQPQFLINFDDAYVSPMKNCPQHANILIAKKLSLVRFNFVKDLYKLKFLKQKNAVFEFQQYSYKSQYHKGILKEIQSTLDIETKYKANLESFVFEQLKYQNCKNPVFKEIDDNEILKTVTDLEYSSFGTAFVFYQVDNAIKFAKKYNTQNIYNVDIGEEVDCTGFNSILVAPYGIDWAKNFNKIIFMDAVLDKGFLAKINQISTAEILLNKNTINNLLLAKINIGRENFGKIYNIFKKINNTSFYSFQNMYNEFVSSKINFYDFYAGMLVFCELEILKLNYNKNDISVIINDKIKVQLSNSKIFNFINFVKNIAE